jgi:superfamily II DNA or RNA helicase
MKWLIDTGKISTDNNTVILYKNISTLEDMHSYLKENYPQFTYYVIEGEVKALARESIRHSMEQSSGNIILATYGCMKQGVNIKRLDTAVFAEPAKSPYMVMQSVGRVVRKCRGKTIARVFDIVDDASYRSEPRWTGGEGKLHENYMMRHFTERCSYYSKDRIPVNEIRMDGIITATVDIESIKNKRKDAAKKAKEKKAKFDMSGYRPKFGFR